MFSGKEISENVDDGHSKKITKEMVANVESDVIDDAGVVITVETQIFEQTVLYTDFLIFIIYSLLFIELI